MCHFLPGTVAPPRRTTPRSGSLARVGVCPVLDGPCRRCLLSPNIRSFVRSSKSWADGVIPSFTLAPPRRSSRRGSRHVQCRRGRRSPQRRRAFAPRLKGQGGCFCSSGCRKRAQFGQVPKWLAWRHCWSSIGREHGHAFATKLKGVVGERCACGRESRRDVETGTQTVLDGH